jgi:hypothetical protein
MTQHPDPTAAPAGSFNVTMSMATGTSTSSGGTQVSQPVLGASINSASRGRKQVGTAAAASDQSTVEVQIHIISYKTESGEIDYVFDPSTITFSGTDCSQIDKISTIDMFDMISRAIVQQGVQMGMTPCSADCSSPDIVTRVYSSSCVKRSGTGCGTKFTCCSSKTYCERAFAVCCPNGIGNPTISMVSVESTGCDPTAGPHCEPLCP